ncbi:expressed unknown protein [Seminavis robusta]|uniref:Uncharacterized protein n=1 Tax=Seminavis robusta TaxID=568900 RepID=A0A9N8DM97_9STRA|nr:expressed unknown protein [Seminavis robusta]|eukprot:Sro133_g063240.1 n/a (117) ;mRNA; r:106217-106567
MPTTNDFRPCQLRRSHDGDQHNTLSLSMLHRPVSRNRVNLDSTLMARTSFSRPSGDPRPGMTRESATERMHRVLSILDQALDTFEEDLGFQQDEEESTTSGTDEAAATHSREHPSP